MRSVLRYLAIALGLMLLAALGLRIWLGAFDVVHSSTGAWIMAHVTRVIDVGDYAAAASIGRVPNTSYNVLYPLLVVLTAGNALGEALGGPVTVAHYLSAAFLGLACLPLASLWRPAGGLPGAVLGAAALFFPPILATAALIRYESLAIALILLCAWACLAATQRAGWWRWAAAGLLIGLVYNTREYLVGSALACVGVAWLMAIFSPPVAGRSRWRQGSTSLFLILDGLILGVVVIPVALDFWPQNGLEYLLSYGSGHGVGPGPSRFTTGQLYDLPQLAIPFGLGVLGLLVSVIRWKGTRRRAALIILALLLPFLAFPISQQQSPQYYLLAKVLLISGWAGLVALLPWSWLRAGVAVVVMAALLPSIAKYTPPLVAGEQSDDQRFHSEAWPALPRGPAEIVDWANRTAESSPLVVITGHIENLDALFVIRHHRPVASLYDQRWREQLPQVSLIYKGQDLLVLTVGNEYQPVAPPPGATLVDTMEAPNLQARIHRVTGTAPPENWTHPGYPCLDFRGACLQRDWLEGGEEAVRRRTLEPGPEYAGGPGPGRIR